MSGPHQRSVIREALVARLIAGGTLAGNRVHDNPTKPRTAFPAISVADVGEDQTAVSGRGANRAIQRKLVLEVSCEVKQTGDYARDRDWLGGEVEALFATAVGVLPGISLVLPLGWGADAYTEAEQPIAVGRQRFQITYLTTQGDPTATY